MKTNFSSGRRTFIKRATLLGGSALALALGVPKTARPAAAPASEPQAQNQGYRLTAHVKKYYETARQ
ncbi:MAG: formate dehydrogenase [Deltaproteobacteria bacterium]|nr:formate dehydrogenase [Deltaproteobacteria bacterium]